MVLPVPVVMARSKAKADAYNSVIQGHTSARETLTARIAELPAEMERMKNRPDVVELLRDELGGLKKLLVAMATPDVLPGALAEEESIIRKQEMNQRVIDDALFVYAKAGKDVADLLDLGADVTQCPEGLTALHHAAWMGHGNVVDQLLVHRAPTAGRATSGGHTPLHLACMEPVCESVVKSLLRAGACEAALTDGGETPEDLILGVGHEGVRILLHRASERKHWGFMIVVRKLMQKEGFVRPVKLRRSRRRMDPRVMSAAEFLVDGDRAPDGVFRKVMSFIC